MGSRLPGDGEEETSSPASPAESDGEDGGPIRGLLGAQRRWASRSQSPLDRPSAHPRFCPGTSSPEPTLLDVCKRVAVRPGLGKPRDSKPRRGGRRSMMRGFLPPLRGACWVLGPAHPGLTARANFCRPWRGSLLRSLSLLRLLRRPQLLLQDLRLPL